MKGARGAESHRLLLPDPRGPGPQSWDRQPQGKRWLTGKCGAFRNRNPGTACSPWNPRPPPPSCGVLGSSPHRRLQQNPNCVVHWPSVSEVSRSPSGAGCWALPPVPPTPPPPTGRGWREGSLGGSAQTPPVCSLVGRQVPRHSRRAAGSSGVARAGPSLETGLTIMFPPPRSRV